MMVLTSGEVLKGVDVWSVLLKPSASSVVNSKSSAVLKANVLSSWKGKVAVSTVVWLCPSGTNKMHVYIEQT